MALNSLGLGFVFTAKDMASGKISQLAKSFGGMDKAALSANESYQRNFTAMGLGLGIMAAGAATLAGAFALANVAGEFEQQIAKVGAISQASAADLKRLHDAAIEAGIATQFSPTEAAAGLEALASQGFKATQSIKLLRPVLDLAAGGAIGVESAAEAITSAVHVFGLNMEQAAFAADKLLAISNGTALAAKDLQMALGTVGRGASMTNQKLEEMLISMGLVRNTGVDASVAAQSVSSALVFMAGRAGAFKKLGVSVTDAQGKFRPFLDVVMDTSKVLGSKYTDEAERAAMATKLFSRFGLQAYSAIVKQLGTGIRDEATGAILHGAEAMEYLRDKMEHTDGVAAKFREQMLNTFEGQKKLLHGSMQTLAIMIGEPLAKAFKPVVAMTLETVNKVIDFVRTIPEEVKGPFFKAIVVVGGFAMAFGAVVAAVAGFLVLKPFLIAMGTALGGVMSAILPVLLYVGLIAGAVMVMRYAVEQNLGGLGYVWREFSTGVRAAVQGLIQLFTQGGFSGAVREYFANAEHSGLKRFVIALYQVGFRVAQFFRGMKIGITTGLDEAAPAFNALHMALVGLGRALGFVAAAGPKAIAGIPSEVIGQRGAMIGLFISKIIGWVTKAATAIISFATGIIDGFSVAVASFAPVFRVIGPMLSWLASEFMELLRTLGLVSGTADDGMGAIKSYGMVLGWLAGTVASLVVGAFDLVGFAIGGVILVVKGLVVAFKWVMGFTFRVGEVIGSTLLKILHGIMDIVDGGVVGLAALVNKIPVSMRPAWANALSRAGDSAGADILKRDRQDTANTKHDFTTSFYPAAAEADSKREDSRAQTAALNRVASMVEQQKKDREQPVQVTLNVDGEKLAETSTAAGRRARATAFEPVGSVK